MVERLVGRTRRPGRHMVELDRIEAMTLLASVPYGRMVFTRDALPAIRTVIHVVERDEIIVARLTLPSDSGRAVVKEKRNVVVAFEADEIDPVRQVGWSVVATGFANTVTDPERLAHYRQALCPWAEDAVVDIIAIEPTIVTGLRLIAA
ncbi:pyridoxamine 5'-phosphate oxidase family protein [Nocardia uniformis]|uniref:Pyridoxamine 5'-phosphate oxidase family protein n=1 Tax=Nocardia uniformis TaxID=53432 RepID=A0A849BWC1_9NOCA|nr:pyridoxamine 5'-phosphate oxidase family protein [Nocardia uniformis]NNH69286.1 pyridoxamine 5'-phosphate oxidase family protein [Nocardia uniformis]